MRVVDGQLQRLDLWGGAESLQFLLRQGFRIAPFVEVFPNSMTPYMAVEVIKACSSISAAAKLLNLDWQAVQAIMDRAVARGIVRRNMSNIRNVGIDEKSFGKGQDYVSIMTDVDNARVLEVVPERTRVAADKLWQLMDKLQRKLIQAVSMDMWSTFMEATRAACPDAAIVHDKFHVSKYLGEAVDKVRRQEHVQLSEDGDDRLKGTRQL